MYPRPLCRRFVESGRVTCLRLIALYTRGLPPLQVHFTDVEARHRSHLHEYNCPSMSQTTIDARSLTIQRGRRLEYFTIAWNCLESFIAVAAGLFAGSISLVGFGIDSLIEVTSGAALLWRMSVDTNLSARERNERKALRIVGLCFLALAAYVTYESVADLWSKKAPDRSIPGIILACVSLIAMPILSRAKRNVGTALKSAAMHADARQTAFCAYLSAILLVGLVLNAAFGLWWADPLAALIMVPIIANEGIQAWKGNACDDCRNRTEPQHRP